MGHSSVEFPPPVARLFEILTGEQAGSTREGRLRDFADLVDDLAAGMRTAEPLLATGVRRIRQGVQGGTHDAFLASMERLLGPDGLLEAAAGQLSGIAGKLRKTSTDVQYGKLMVIAILVELLVEIAVAAAFAFFNPAAAMEWLAARFAIARFLVETVLGRVLLAIAVSQVAGVGLNVLMDSIVQRSQIDGGWRDHVDGKLESNAAAGGSLGATIGLVLGGVGGRILGHQGWFREFVVGGIAEAGSEVLTEGLMNLAETGEFKVEWANATAGLTAATAEALGGGIGNASRPERHPDTHPEGDRGGPGGADRSVTAHDPPSPPAIPPSPPAVAPSPPASPPSPPAVAPSPLPSTTLHVADLTGAESPGRSRSTGAGATADTSRPAPVRDTRSATSPPPAAGQNPRPAPTPPPGQPARADAEPSGPRAVEPARAGMLGRHGGATDGSGASSSADAPPVHPDDTGDGRVPAPDSAAESVRHEPSAESVRHEPSAESARHEPWAESVRHEPSAESVRHEPWAESVRHEPSVERSVEHPAEALASQHDGVRGADRPPTGAPTGPEGVTEDQSAEQRSGGVSIGVDLSDSTLGVELSLGEDTATTGQVHRGTADVAVAVTTRDTSIRSEPRRVGTREIPVPLGPPPEPFEVSLAVDPVGATARWDSALRSLPEWDGRTPDCLDRAWAVLTHEGMPKPAASSDDRFVGGVSEALIGERFAAAVRLGSADVLETAVRAAGVGATALVFTSPPGRPRHAVGLHHGEDGTLRWIDFQRRSVTAGARPPFLVDMRVLLLDRALVPRQDLLPTGSGPGVAALLDPPTTRRPGMDPGRAPTGGLKRQRPDSDSDLTSDADTDLTSDADTDGDDGIDIDEPGPEEDNRQVVAAGAEWTAHTRDWLRLVDALHQDLAASSNGNQRKRLAELLNDADQAVLAAVAGYKARNASFQPLDLLAGQPRQSNPYDLRYPDYYYRSQGTHPTLAIAGNPKTDKVSEFGMEIPSRLKSNEIWRLTGQRRSGPDLLAVKLNPQRLDQLRTQAALLGSEPEVVEAADDHQLATRIGEVRQALQDVMELAYTTAGPMLGTAEATDPATRDDVIGSYVDRRLDRLRGFGDQLVQRLAGLQNLTVHLNGRNPAVTVHIGALESLGLRDGVRDRVVEWLQVYLGGLASTVAARFGLPLPLQIRQSFGHLDTTVSDTGPALRISPGSEPAEYIEVLAEAIRQLDAQLPALLNLIKSDKKWLGQGIWNPTSTDKKYAGWYHAVKITAGGSATSLKDFVETTVAATADSLVGKRATLKPGGLLFEDERAGGMADLRQEATQALGGIGLDDSLSQRLAHLAAETGLPIEEDLADAVMLSDLLLRQLPAETHLPRTAAVALDILSAAAAGALAAMSAHRGPPTERAMIHLQLRNAVEDIISASTVLAAAFDAHSDRNPVDDATNIARAVFEKPDATVSFRSNGMQAITATTLKATDGQTGEAVYFEASDLADRLWPAEKTGGKRAGGRSNRSRTVLADLAPLGTGPQPVNPDAATRAVRDLAERTEPEGDRWAVLDVTAAGDPLGSGLARRLRDANIDGTLPAVLVASLVKYYQLGADHLAQGLSVDLTPGQRGQVAQTPMGAPTRQMLSMLLDLRSANNLTFPEELHPYLQAIGEFAYDGLAPDDERSEVVGLVRLLQRLDIGEDVIRDLFTEGTDADGAWVTFDTAAFRDTLDAWLSRYSGQAGGSRTGDSRTGGEAPSETRLHHVSIGEILAEATTAPSGPIGAALPYEPTVAQYNFLAGNHLRLEPIDPNGNCLFAAVLPHVQGTAQTVDQLRTFVTDRFQEDPDYWAFVADQNPAEVAAEMRRSEAWDGQHNEIAIGVLAAELNLRLMIVNPGGTVTPMGEGSGPEVYLVRVTDPLPHYHGTAPIHSDVDMDVPSEDQPMAYPAGGSLDDARGLSTLQASDLADVFVDGGRRGPVGRALLDGNATVVGWDFTAEGMSQAEADAVRASVGDGFLVLVHGADGRVSVGGRWLSARELADLIRATPGWRGRPLVLAACEAGAGFAGRLAVLLGVDVTATANLALRYRDSGRIVGGSRRFAPDGSMRLAADARYPFVRFPADGGEPVKIGASPTPLERGIADRETSSQATVAAAPRPAAAPTVAVPGLSSNSLGARLLGKRSRGSSVDTADTADPDRRKRRATAVRESDHTLVGRGFVPPTAGQRQRLADAVARWGRQEAGMPAVTPALLRLINPTGDAFNCLEANLALWDTLDGSARPAGTRPGPQPERAAVWELTKRRGPAWLYGTGTRAVGELVELVRQGGPGSRAIVMTAAAGAVGHARTLLHGRDGRLLWVDPQRHTVTPVHDGVPGPGVGDRVWAYVEDADGAAVRGNGRYDESLFHSEDSAHPVPEFGANPTDGGLALFRNRPIFSQLGWADAAREFERRLGRYLFQVPEARMAVQSALSRLRLVIEQHRPDVGVEPLRAFVHDDATSAGQVGGHLHRAEIVRLLEGGNLRELMTAFYNAAYYRPAGGLTFKSVLKDLFEKADWTAVADLDLDVDALRTYEEYLAGASRRTAEITVSILSPQNAHLFAPGDPFALGNLIMRDAPWSEIAAIVGSQLARVPRTPADRAYGPGKRTSRSYHHAGAELSRRELAFLNSEPLTLVGVYLEEVSPDRLSFDEHGMPDLRPLYAEPGVIDVKMVSDQTYHPLTETMRTHVRSVVKVVQQTSRLDRPRDADLPPDVAGPELPLPSLEGATLYTLNTNSLWYRNGQARGFRMLTGISGTTARMVAAFGWLNASAPREHFLAAVAGWMLTSDDHSLYEILRGAGLAGFIPPDGTFNLTDAVSMYESLPALGDVLSLDRLRRFVCEDELFPHEIIYRDLAEGLGSGRRLAAPGILGTGAASQLWDFIVQADGGTVDSELGTWLVDNGLNARQLRTRVSKAHLIAFQAYTGPDHWFINLVIARGLGPDGSLPLVDSTRIALQALMEQMIVARLQLEDQEEPMALFDDEPIDDLLTEYNRANSEERELQIRERLSARVAEILPDVLTEARLHADMVVQGLLALPPVTGEVWRGDWAFDGLNLPAWVVPTTYGGDTITFHDLASSSRDPGIALGFAKRQTPGWFSHRVLLKLTLTGRYGRDISYFSGKIGEWEVAFLPGARFRVTSRTMRYDADGSLEYELIEAIEIDATDLDVGARS